jgi:HEPN domain-containing protein
MNDNEKRVNAWCRAARSDLDTAGLLIQESKFLHGLLFCHYAIEKGFYAHMMKLSKELPSEPISLNRLPSLASVKVGEQDMSLLKDLSNYQLELRFPENQYNHLSEQKVVDYLKRSRELFIWLEKTL